MSTDRELLERAATAAGIQYNTARARSSGWILSTITEAPDLSHVEQPIWNPLGDDGDAMRLAVLLGFRIYVYCGGGDDCTTVAGDELNSKGTHINEPHQDDRFAATRRAIVRAAAEIGRAMP